MKSFQVRDLDGRMLFEGSFGSFRQCLETAVRKKTDLENADLRHKNLSNANLDGARMRSADLTGANLTGANLSESDLSRACFENAALYNTCLALSDLRGCVFDGTAFGATDIAGADISHARFSTLSCFTLDFLQTRAMDGCRFFGSDGTASAMSRPPLIITGLQSAPLIVFDRHVRLGHALLGSARRSGLPGSLKSLVSA